MVQQAFIILSIVVVALYLLEGWVASKHTKGYADYVIGGRKINPYVCAFTLVATFASGSAYMGTQGIGYKVGFANMHIWLPNMFGLTLGILVASKRLRVYSEKLGSMTPSDFLGERYGSKGLRAWAAIATILLIIPMTMGQFKAGSLLLNVLFGWDPHVSVLIFGLIVMIYVAVGGFLAVVYTDTFQGIIMLAVSLTVVPYTFFKLVGGPAGLVAKLTALGKPSWYYGSIATPPQAGFDPVSAIGFWFLGVVGAMGAPFLLVRFFCVKDTSRPTMRRYGVTAVVILTLCSMMTLLGPMIYALEPNIKMPDLAFPTFAVKFLHPWLAAFIIIGIWAAIMSSVDSYVILQGGILAHDLVERFSRTKPDPKRLEMIARVGSMVLTLIPMFLTFFKLPAFIALIVAFGWGSLGLLYLPTLLIGSYWRRASATGALLAAILGPAVNALLVALKWTQGKAFLVALPVGLIAYFLGSLLTSPVSKDRLALVGLDDSSQPSAVSGRVAQG